jgi:hypothetical protein
MPGQKLDGAFRRSQEDTASGTPTGERARSGGAAQAGLFVVRGRARWHGNMKHCICRRSASFFFLLFVIASEAKQSSAAVQQPPAHEIVTRPRWIASSLTLLAMTSEGARPLENTSLFDN